MSLLFHLTVLFSFPAAVLFGFLRNYGLSPFPVWLIIFFDNFCYFRNVRSAVQIYDCGWLVSLCSIIWTPWAPLAYNGFRWIPFFYTWFISANKLLKQHVSPSSASRILFSWFHTIQDFKFIIYNSNTLLRIKYMQISKH